LTFEEKGRFKLKQLSASSFEFASCQASVFTPDGGFSAAKIVKQFYPEHEKLFDASPTVLPVPEDAPLEIPRVILQSNSHEWKCQLSPARADIVWARTKSTRSQISLRDFFQKAGSILLEYTGILGTRVGRAAGLATRFCEHETPGVFLARHFCQERWEKQPLDRPENFELHAHKKFVLAKEFQVNSWARNKTGLLAGEPAQKPIVLFEQDINTLAETAADKSFQKDEIIRFLAAVTVESDAILRLYYPDVR
jgi:hypothetical protein